MAGSIVLNTRDGAKLHVPRAIDQITPYVLLEQDDWFEDEIRFVRAMLRPGQFAVDIGANHGVYTVAMANAVGSRGAVCAFEPTPQTADLLARSLAGLGQVQLVRSAVSNFAGTAQLRVGAESEANALVAAGENGSIPVPVKPLDMLAAELGWKDVDFMKIDAEGHEPQIIDGGSDVFTRQSPLVMFEIANDGREAAAGRFRALGYAIYRLVPGLGLLAPVGPGESLDPFQINLFCCKPDRARQLAAAGLLADTAASVPGDDAVALHGIAADASRAPADRLGALRRALDCSLDQPAPSVAALMSRTRIARDFGARHRAYEAAKALLAAFPRHWHESVGAPRLAPTARFDTVPTDGEDLDWIACAAAEAGLELACHSTIYVGMQAMPVIRMLDGNPFRSPMTERRRQLVRMRAGLQAGPERHALLETATADNLNPAYWRGET